MAKTPPPGKKGNKEATGRTEQNEEEMADRIDSQQAHDSNGEVPERDFATEDNGVPRSDWNDEGAREIARQTGKAAGTKTRRRPKIANESES